MRKAVVAVCGALLAVGVGILADIFGAKQMIVDALPVLHAFLPVIALGFVGAAIGWMLFLAGQSIYAKCPHNRFSALHDEISQELERTETYLSFPMFAHEGSRWAKRQSLAIKLNALKVRTPASHDDRAWMDILPPLVSYSGNGRLSDAKKL